QGGMINLFDFSANGWLSGLGRSAAWSRIPFDQKRIAPKYLISEQTLLAWPKFVRGIKLGQRRICRASDTRTLILCPCSGFGGGDPLATLLVQNGDLYRTFLAAAVLSSFGSDLIARLKVAGTHLDWYQLEQLPLPFLNRAAEQSAQAHQLVSNTSRLTFL